MMSADTAPKGDGVSRPITLNAFGKKKLDTVITAQALDSAFTLTLGGSRGEFHPINAVTVGTKAFGWDDSSKRNPLRFPNGDDPSSPPPH